MVVRREREGEGGNKTLVISKLKRERERGKSGEERCWSWTGGGRRGREGGGTKYPVGNTSIVILKI